MFVPTSYSAARLTSAPVLNQVTTSAEGSSPGFQPSTRPVSPNRLLYTASRPLSPGPSRNSRSASPVRAVEAMSEAVGVLAEGSPELSEGLLVAESQFEEDVRTMPEGAADSVRGEPSPSWLRAHRARFPNA